MTATLGSDFGVTSLKIRGLGARWDILLLGEAHCVTAARNEAMTSGYLRNRRMIRRSVGLNVPENAPATLGAVEGFR